MQVWCKNYCSPRSEFRGAIRQGSLEGVMLEGPGSLRGQLPNASYFIVLPEGRLKRLGRAFSGYSRASWWVHRCIYIYGVKWRIQVAIWITQVSFWGNIGNLTWIIQVVVHVSLLYSISPRTIPVGEENNIGKCCQSTNGAWEFLKS